VPRKVEDLSLRSLRHCVWIHTDATVDRSSARLALKSFAGFATHAGRGLNEMQCQPAAPVRWGFYVARCPIPAGEFGVLERVVP
jgi:hypothetical protein